MQKKIIALAVAGLVSGVAFAQSNVTVYGVADVAYMYRSVDNTTTGATNSFNGIADGGAAGLQGSRFGFRGEEGLGSGLKAIFTLEFGHDLDNDGQTGGFSPAPASLGNRQTFLGLDSATLGTITVGRQYNAASDYYGKNSANGWTSINPGNLLQGGSGSQIRSQGGNARQDNSIKYASPVFSGFSARASYAFAENPGQTSATFTPAVATATLSNASTADSGRYAIAVDYTNGPLNVDAILAGQLKVRTNYGGGVGFEAQGKDIAEWYLGGAYDFKMAKLYATYQQLKNDSKVKVGDTWAGTAAAQTASTVTKTKFWTLGVSVPVSTAGTIRAEYADIGYTTGNEVTDATTFNGKSKGYGLGYTHELSKRTTLYTFYSSLKHDTNSAVNGGTATLATTFNVPGKTNNNFAMGMNHKF